MTQWNALCADAEKLLRANDRGGYTLASPSLYPHQWNWDSAFAAIGWRHIDPRRAARELEMLLRGQWDDGLIPHIIFNREANYEPGPATWRTLDAPGAPTLAPASSITQPPVAATAARRVLERAGGDPEVTESLRRVTAALERWHAWFLATRDPTGIGAVAIVHPWESGMDNAPRWDVPMARIEPGEVVYRRVDNTVVDASQRPTHAQYDRYFFLVGERARHKFAPPVPETEALLVADAAMTAILCRAEEDLLWLGAQLGVATPGAASRRARLLGGLGGALWDQARGAYTDVDLVSGQALHVEHVASYVPLFAGVTPAAEARVMAARLADPTSYGGATWPVPSVPPGEPGFEPTRYWRGPTWINCNWMLIEGLRTSGFAGQARELARRTLELIAKSGFHEYFNPLTGEGAGASDFSWTAALALDLVHEGAA